MSLRDVNAPRRGDGRSVAYCGDDGGVVRRPCDIPYCEGCGESKYLIRLKGVYYCTSCRFKSDCC